MSISGSAAWMVEVAMTLSLSMAMYEHLTPAEDARLGRAARYLDPGVCAVMGRARGS